MTLTTNQKKYRQRKEDSNRDFRRTTKPDGKSGRRVTRKAICARVSQDANERLNHWADYWKMSRWEFLTHIIHQKLPQYLKQIEGYNPLNPYRWDEELLQPEDRVIRYKGTKGDVQLNERISTTAWKTLDCHSTATKMSKARIIQELLLTYKPVSEAQREANRIYREKGRQWKQEWQANPPQLIAQTPEQMEATRKEWERIEAESEARWERIMGEAKARYQHGE